MIHSASPTSEGALAVGERPATAVRRRRDRRLVTAGLVLVSIAAIGTMVHWLINREETGTVLPAAIPETAPFAGMPAGSPALVPMAEVEPQLPKVSPTDKPGSEATEVMKLAAADIKAKRYDDALRRLSLARPLIQQYPESYLMLGSALEGKKDYAAARDFYNAAIDRNPYLSEAYWGFATSSEQLGDLPSAIGGMRNFLHTQPSPDPNRLKVVQARSALWEWESQLGRGPWGPTKGIPPGFTREELKRDGRGVGIKMPILESKTPDGTMKYEIKHQKKYNHFKPD